jgi:hypothetical protein
MTGWCKQIGTMILGSERVNKVKKYTYGKRKLQGMSFVKIQNLNNEATYLQTYFVIISVHRKCQKKHCMFMKSNTSQNKHTGYKL